MKTKISLHLGAVYVFSELEMIVGCGFLGKNLVRRTSTWEGLLQVEHCNTVTRIVRHSFIYSSLLKHTWGTVVFQTLPTNMGTAKFPRHIGGGRDL